MSKHPYDYSMLIEYLNPVPSSGVPNYSQKTDEQSLTLAIEEVMEHLPDAIEEGWEVNSHGLTIAENTIILSILLRRPHTR
jgi:hypothetical protein